MIAKYDGQRFAMSLLIALSVYLSPGRTYALETVEVKYVSSSSRSLIIDSGHLEGLKLGLYAQVVSLNNSEGRLRPRLENLGLAELIKVTPTQSFWYFHELSAAADLAPGQSVQLIRQDKSLAGLRSQDVIQRKVILSPDQRLEDVYFESREGMPAEMISDMAENYDSRDLELTDQSPEFYDLETEEYDVWSQKNRKEFVDKAMRELEVQYVGQTEKVTDAEKFRAEDERKVFRSYVDQVISAVNSHEAGLNQLYQKDLNKSYKSYVSTVLNKRSLYHQVTEPEEERLDIKSHAMEKVKRDGDLWSADLNDQQLRDFIVKSGVEKELRRQDRALGESLAHEFLFRASTGLVGHANENDPNFQNLNYSLSASYEYALQRTSETFRQWTIEAEVFTGINFYEMAPELNGRFQEGGFGAALNYYFYNNPMSVNKLAFYSGLALRRSSATGGSQILEGQQTYDYQVLTSSLQLGAKYRFKAGDSYLDKFKIGMGVNALLSLDSKSLNLVEEDELEGPVYSSFDIQDTRLSVGLSLYF